MKTSAIVLLLICLSAWAVDENGATSSPYPYPMVSSQSAPAKAKRSSSAVKKKSKRTGEKEAEGTEAPDRFETDTVIKSQYKLNGEPLEVDPD